ncbi:protein arginine N-methyltransferase 1 isoform X2 [Drosophila grimshawi]|uniref:protein arginine N-methyltransferase 1 isoform X2 n=1 Tax=Drosophila grimshawi TaxID=7222 RepID=UPI000C8707C4|nr:protein arginine N-methyltransferase 1 isoform X2 [Drosophila grimshawi]
MEDPWDMAENMLSDVLVSNVYNQFFKNNSDLFKDKIVMDVGCRSGLLSLLAVEAGAVKVFAVGNMRSARYVTKALGHGENAEVFEPLKGCISQIRLPCGLKKVDIIVSEWMGHALFADSLFRQMLEARDKWLARGGHIFPNVANLYIHGIAQSARQTMNKNLRPVLLTDEYVNQQSVITENRFQDEGVAEGQSVWMYAVL